MSEKKSGVKYTIHKSIEIVHEGTILQLFKKEEETFISILKGETHVNIVLSNESFRDIIDCWEE